MTELKKKLINYLSLNGKKSINEKKIKRNFKRFNTIYCKNVKNIIQLSVLCSSFIFKFSTKRNSSTFFMNKKRVFFAIKQIIKFHFFKKSVETYLKDLQSYKKSQNIFLTNKKILYFYRWK